MNEVRESVRHVNYCTWNTSLDQIKYSSSTRFENCDSTSNVAICSWLMLNWATRCFIRNANMLEKFGLGNFLGKVAHSETDDGDDTIIVMFSVSDGSKQVSFRVSTPLVILNDFFTYNHKDDILTFTPSNGFIFRMRATMKRIMDYGKNIQNISALDIPTTAVTKVRSWIYG